MSDAPTETAVGESTSPAPEQGRRSRRFVRVLLLLIALVLGYLLLWPSPIDPAAFEPDAPPALTGPLAPNDRLAKAEWIATGKVHGPEDVEVDAEGHVFTGTEDGRVVRIDPDGTVADVVNTGGRPVGIDMDAAGNLIVADAIKGLLSVSNDGKITPLVPSDGDFPLGFADDVTVANDGMIYFSDASDKFKHDEYLLDMLEARPHGRLLRYDPATKKTDVLSDGLYFANGVALSKDEDFLLVNETYRYRVKRYWLKGDRAGQVEDVLENLPGFPDNITSAPDGGFWLALFTVRNDDAEWLAPRPFAKSVLAKLPKFLWPKPEPYAFAVKLDANGQIVDSLQDPKGERLFAITSVTERDGNLYLGSLINDRVGKQKLSE
jgi:sugar lactone lactonase YvrE